MILIDRRTGSKELHPLFPAGTAVMDELPCADFAFTGRGAGGKEMFIGIERKTLTDMLDSIKTGRFAGHQLPLLRATYNRVYLVLEGIYRPNPQSGLLEVSRRGDWEPIYLGRKGWMYRQLDAYVTTLETKADVRLRRTAGMSETAHQVISLWHWWNDKEYEKHRAHEQHHDLTPQRMYLTPPPLVQRVAKEFTGIGWERAGTVAQRFKSVVEMANADCKQWQEIPGIGAVIAKKVIGEINDARE